MSSAAPQDAVTAAQGQAAGSKKKKNKKNKPKKALDTSTANNANDGTGTAEPSPRDSNRELSADEEPDTPVVSREARPQRAQTHSRFADPSSWTHSS